MTWWLRGGIFLSWLGYSVSTLAQIQVLGVIGHSESLARYVPLLNADALATQSAEFPPLATRMANWAQAASVPRFPVNTPTLSPGTVEARTVNLPYIKRPVFLLGFDDLSRQWLRRYRARLAMIQAEGMVVNVESADQFAQLQQEATVNGIALELAPVPGTRVANMLDIRHYPVLISTRLLEQ